MFVQLRQTEKSIEWKMNSKSQVDRFGVNVLKILLVVEILRNRRYWMNVKLILTTFILTSSGLWRLNPHCLFRSISVRLNIGALDFKFIHLKLFKYTVSFRYYIKGGNHIGIFLFWRVRWILYLCENRKRVQHVKAPNKMQICRSRHYFAKTPATARTDKHIVPASLCNRFLPFWIALSSKETSFFQSKTKSLNCNKQIKTEKPINKTDDTNRELNV